MKWFHGCAFCDMRPKVLSHSHDYGLPAFCKECKEDKPMFEHQSHCVFNKVMRAAKWAGNGVLIILDGRRAELPKDK